MKRFSTGRGWHLRRLSTTPLCVVPARLFHFRNIQQWIKNYSLNNFYRPQMKLWVGNLLTRICLSTGVSAIFPGTRPPFPPPERNIRPDRKWHHNLPEPQKRTVRILLECFLVSFVFDRQTSYNRDCSRHKCSKYQVTFRFVQFRAVTKGSLPERCFWY